MISMPDEVTLYLARKLHLPLDGLLERYVVVVLGRHVIAWYPFDNEAHSMLFVDEIHVTRNGDGTLMVESVRF